MDTGLCDVKFSTHFTLVQDAHITAPIINSCKTKNEFLAPQGNGDAKKRYFGYTEIESYSPPFCKVLSRVGNHRMATKLASQHVSAQVCLIPTLMPVTDPGGERLCRIISSIAYPQVCNNLIIICKLEIVN